MRNVLISAGYRARRSGNFIASLLELGQTLRRKGCRIVYMFPDNHSGGYSWSKWLEENGFTVLFFDENLDKEKKLEVLSGYLHKYDIGIVHIHFGYMMGMFLKNKKQLGDYKVIIHDHMDYKETGSRLKQRFRTVCMAVAYRYYSAYCISVMKQKDKDYFLMGRKHHCFIPNGLSFLRAETDTLTREERRRELGLSDNDRLVLLLGWDLHLKGLDIAAKAVEKCRQEGISVKLGAIGIGRDGKPYDGTVEYLKSYGIDPYADWIVYMNNYEDMFAIYRAADVFLSSSRADAFSYAILEASSQDTPVVMSDIPGTSWANAYSRCFTYPCEDIERCAGAIKKALRADEIESNSGEVVKKYSAKKWCSDIIDVYERVERR